MSRRAHTRWSSLTSRRRARAATASKAGRHDASRQSESTWESAPPPLTPDELRRLSAESRARAQQLEAQQDLERLRRRYWSGERLIEESKSDLPWWEHPEADPYAVLELLPGASIAEAAAARREIARRCHPDVTGKPKVSDLSLRHMIAANAAYDRLRRALQPV
jgi:hypothetical protein